MLFTFETIAEANIACELFDSNIPCDCWMVRSPLEIFVNIGLGGAATELCDAANLCFSCRAGK